jgi:metal-sulfur cluster biosynthetic enzyme
MSNELVNPTPKIHGAVELDSREVRHAIRENHEDERDEFDAIEIYELIKSIKDPEHPHTLEQLRVVNLNHISVDDCRSQVKVMFTPTVPHCSMTTLIGLCIRVKLANCLPSRFKIDVKVAPGTHDQELSVNKQLSDKERVAAALENKQLVQVVWSCLADVEGGDQQH